MGSKTHTGGMKEFRYTGREEYDDTESTARFKEDLKVARAQGKLKKKKLRFSPFPKKKYSKARLILLILLVLYILYRLYQRTQ